MPSAEQCFQILGLSSGATNDQIRQAHRDLVKVWHPDRFAHDVRLQKQAEEKLKAINEAYDFLMGSHPQAARAQAPAGARSAQPKARRQAEYHEGQPVTAFLVSVITILIALVLVGMAFFFYEKTFQPLSPPTKALSGLA